ncbi:MAG TPA: hypothetical protein VFB51_01740 [Solirubrobacterales bacterium]|nr:hypothetical protein [Solirubrobacterales bacterium]
MAAAEGATAGRELTPAHKRFLVRDAILIAAFVNAALSALIAWLITVGEDEVPVSAVPLAEGPSVLVDSVATCFVLPFLTTLLITTVIWKEMREGHLTRIPRAAGSLAERLPKTRLRRASWIGLGCLATFGPIAAAGVLLFDYGDISIGEFVLYKAIFGIVLGAAVTPWIALAAFGDEPPREEGTPEAPTPATTA